MNKRQVCQRSEPSKLENPQSTLSIRYAFVCLKKILGKQIAARPKFFRWRTSPSQAIVDLNGPSERCLSCFVMLAIVFVSNITSAVDRGHIMPAICSSHAVLPTSV